MPTESKTRTYLLPVASSMQTVANASGQAIIGKVETVVPSFDPAVLIAPWAWFLTLVGPVTNTNYFDTQRYRVTAQEIANFVNNRAGTSLTALQIANITRSSDSTYFEVTTT